MQPASETSNVTIYVCASCLDSSGSHPLGETVLAWLRDENPDPSKISVEGVECLAVCERPVTISFVAEGKWSYILGDVTMDTPAGDVFSAARAVAASRHGVPEMSDRPPFFRDGVVARIPPPGWQAPA